MALVSLGEEVCCVESECSQQSPRQGFLWSTSPLVVGTLDFPSYYDSLSRVILFELQKLLFYPQNGTASSIQFSHSVMSNSFWPHGLQRARPPCPSPTPGVYSNSCSLSQWCHPTISSSIVPFSSRFQSFLASGSFPMSQLFASGGQSIRVSASTSVLPMNIHNWFPLGWTGWISLQSKTLKSLLQHRSSKASIHGPQFSL